jgi:hypothetical protein
LNVELSKRFSHLVAAAAAAAAAQDFFASQICQTVLQYITGNIIMLLFFKPGKTM